MCEHAVVRTPAVQNMSLTPSGMPASRPPSPRAIAASARAAISRARSGVSSTKALSARPSITAAICASTSSAAENARLRRNPSDSARVSEVSSLIRPASPRSRSAALHSLPLLQGEGWGGGPLTRHEARARRSLLTPPPPPAYASREQSPLPQSLGRDDAGARFHRGEPQPIHLAGQAHHTAFGG